MGIIAAPAQRFEPVDFVLECNTPIAISSGTLNVEWDTFYDHGYNDIGLVIPDEMGLETSDFIVFAATELVLLHLNFEWKWAAAPGHVGEGLLSHPGYGSSYGVPYAASGNNTVAYNHIQHLGLFLPGDEFRLYFTGTDTETPITYADCQITRLA